MLYWPNHPRMKPFIFLPRLFSDVHGKIRIWDTTQKEHILKAEYPCIGGPIKDIDWSPDSQKIVCGGEGKERFGEPLWVCLSDFIHDCSTPCYSHFQPLSPVIPGRVFSMDTGTTVGEISGQSKALNAVAFRCLLLLLAVLAQFILRHCWRADNWHS